MFDFIHFEGILALIGTVQTLVLLTIILITIIICSSSVCFESKIEMFYRSKI